MSDSERDQLRKHILGEIDDLKFDITELEEATQPIAPDGAYGRLSRMDAINSKSVNEAALRSARARLSQLGQRLEDIDNAEFGLCVRCKQRIPFARLMFMPESDRCVACADKK